MAKPVGKVEQIRQLMLTCNMSELRALQPIYNECFRKLQAKAAAEFEVGDIVEAKTKRRGMIRVQIQRVNAVTLSGVELAPGASKPHQHATHWKLAPSICKRLDD